MLMENLFALFALFLSLVLATPSGPHLLGKRTAVSLKFGDEGKKPFDLPRSFIVVHNPEGDGNLPLSQFAKKIGGSIGRAPSSTFDGSLIQGLAITLDDTKQVSALQERVDVAYVEPNGALRTAGEPEQKLAVVEQGPDVKNGTEPGDEPYFETQEQSGWGLNRICTGKNYKARHETSGNPLNNPVKKGYWYRYEMSAGVDTCVYVLDTGIDTHHSGFEGRAFHLGENYTELDDGLEHDFHGHGTHIAGIVGSKQHGVSKATHVFSIKVLSKNGEGDYSSLLQGLQVVLGDSEKRKGKECKNGVIVNLSFSTHTPAPISRALERVIRELIKKDIFVVAASGSTYLNAADASPANVPGVCVVGGTNEDDFVLEETNYGPTVSLYAPGHLILGSKAGGGDERQTGSSQAAAFVAGTAAVLKSTYPTIRGPELCGKLQGMAIQDALKKVPKDSKNLMLFTGATPLPKHFLHEDEVIQGELWHKDEFENPLAEWDNSGRQPR